MWTGRRRGKDVPGYEQVPVLIETSRTQRTPVSSPGSFSGIDDQWFPDEHSSQGKISLLQQDGYNNTIPVFNSTDARQITPLTGSTEKNRVKTACRSAGTFHAYGIIPPSGREIP
ncbi:MAG: hypothetical protein STSR0009_10630 [Methanoregula sp.]